MSAKRYDFLFEKGKETLTQGDPQVALGFFEMARESLSPSGEGTATTPEVAQQIGICLRLIGQRRRRLFEDRIAYGRQQARHFQASKEAFEEALNNCGCDVAREAAIRRDFGMLYLVQGLREAADHQLRRSESGLKKLLDTCMPEHRDALTLELAATIGFLARVYMKTNPSRALTLFRRAHSMLAGKHDVYELNNLAWQQKIVPISQRIKLAGRGVQLALRLRNSKRMIQLLIQVPLPALFR